MDNRQPKKWKLPQKVAIKRFSTSHVPPAPSNATPSASNPFDDTTNIENIDQANPGSGKSVARSMWFLVKTILSIIVVGYGAKYIVDSFVLKFLGPPKSVEVIKVGSPAKTTQTPDTFMGLEFGTPIKVSTTWNDHVDGDCELPKFRCFNSYTTLMGTVGSHRLFMISRNAKVDDMPSSAEFDALCKILELKYNATPTIKKDTSNPDCTVLHARFDVGQVVIALICKIEHATLELHALHKGYLELNEEENRNKNAVNRQAGVEAL